MYSKKTNKWNEYLDFIVLEIIGMNISFILAYCIRHGWSVLPYTVPDYLILIGLLCAFDILISVFFNSFESVLKKGYYKEFISSLKHVCMVFALLTLYLFATQQSATYSRISLFLTFGFDLVIGYIVRTMYKKTRRARTTHQRSMLIISKCEKFKNITEAIQSDEDNGIVICGYVSFSEDDKINNAKDKLKEKDEAYNIVASIDNVIEYVCRQWVDEVFIKLDSDENEGIHKVPESVVDIIRKLNEMGVTVHTSLSGLDRLEGQQIVETIGGITVVTSSIRTATAGQLLLKRVIDIVGGLIGCIFTILIAIIIAPFIWIKSPGSIFFKQTRVGLNGKKFKMIKFRSMVKDAEAKKNELISQNTMSQDLMFKLDWDPRIIGNRITSDGKRKTGIGEFLRKTSLDEFPQFFNVLIGDMSLVGTRPPTVDEWEKYDLHHRARLAVRPGITGMWQVSGRSDIKDFEEVVKLDTEYIYNWSIGMDIRILLKTIGVVLRGKGAK